MSYQMNELGSATSTSNYHFINQGLRLKLVICEANIGSALIAAYPLE